MSPSLSATSTTSAAADSAQSRPRRAAALTRRASLLLSRSSVDAASSLRPRTSVPTRARSDHRPPPAVSPRHLRRLRAPSRASLRFAHPDPAAHLHRARPARRSLTRLLLSAVPVHPPPGLYLPRFPPAHNVFRSLLAILAKHTLPHPLHDMLVAASVYPHLHPAESLSPKDSVALDFVRAVAACPPRIPVELRTAFWNMHAPDRAHHIALLASFGAFLSTISSLLGLKHAAAEQPDAEHDSPHPDINAMPEPSEMSAPSSTTHSVASSALSFPARFSSAAKHHFLDRVAHPLRLKLARHSAHHLERSTWLSDIPNTRHAQDHFITASMGFVPEYLHSVRNNSQRAAFIYIVDELLLKDSASGISTAIKNLCCYVLARSAENPVLTAHSAFLANRFGADDQQLTACMDIAMLQAMQSVHTSHDPPSPADSSSSFVSSEEDEILPSAAPTKRRRRSDRFRYSGFTMDVRADHERSLHTSQVEDDSESDDDLSGSGSGGGSQGPVEDDAFRKNGTALKPKEPVRMRFSDQAPEAPPSPYYGTEEHTRASDSDTDTLGSSSQSTTEEDEIQPNSQDCFYALPENPKVPEVNGLNAVVPGEFEQFGSDVVFDEGMCEVSPSRDCGDPDEEVDDLEVELDMTLFSAKEVAFLLLAHQVAQALRRNSQMCSKYAGAQPGPLLNPDLAVVIHELFDPEAIMEMVSVVAAFNFLQRWTVCYPYRPGALEAPVRRFVQTPIAHDLCVDSVGQRTNSKQSFRLRVQTGRSFRLPRHAVVSPCETLSMANAVSPRP